MYLIRYIYVFEFWLLFQTQSNFGFRFCFTQSLR